MVISMKHKFTFELIRSQASFEQMGTLVLRLTGI